MKRKQSGKEIWLVILFFFIAILSVCIFMLRKYNGAISQKENQRIYDQYYVLIADDMRSVYWNAIYESAYNRGQELGIYVDFLGHNLLQDYSKEDKMRIAIASGVDGIILSAGESEELSVLIDEAIAKGIMVVTLQEDTPGSMRLSYIGVGNYNLGREYGKEIKKLATNRLLASDYKQTIDYHVMILVDEEAKGSGIDILSSAITETATTDNIKVVTSFVSFDSSNSFLVEETIRDIFMQGSEPDVIVCLSELSTACAYQTVVDYNKVGQVDILGYYSSDTILNAIDRGVISATMVIDTNQLGEYCVDALNEYHTLGNTSQYYSADITIINKDNVADYLGGGEKNDP
ncbi:MAG: substrate-binding domain-containing protein [Eubacteriales bacterium]|nr:substrate-binding domain-containing protein [Lachnospiraceae bacterium]MDO5128026.1 substrate-binding domain-containing protein [Eubacteriales bacterium]